MGITLTADKIVGKTLVAKKRVPVKDLAYDSAKVVRYVEPGKTVGVVFSYLNPTANRSVVYWMFEPPGQKPFYVPHDPNSFDLDKIKKQIEEEEKKKGGGLFPKLPDLKLPELKLPDFAKMGEEAAKKAKSGLTDAALYIGTAALVIITFNQVIKRKNLKNRSGWSK
jgi:hypothetical protein